MRPSSVSRASYPVPAADSKVVVLRNGNHNTDITHLVHPDNAATAVLAAKIVGLDIAGVDIVAEDITQPLAGQGGAIVEVNAGPSLLMHLRPAIGEAQPVGEQRIVENPADVLGGEHRLDALFHRAVRSEGGERGAPEQGSRGQRQHVEADEKQHRVGDGAGDALDARVGGGQGGTGAGMTKTRT